MDINNDNLPAIEGGKKTRENFLIFGSPEILAQDIEAVVETLKSCWIGTGPRVFEFEKIIADYCNVKYAVAVNSCTAGLHLSLLVSGIGPGDEVITTPMTFNATVNCVYNVGAKPVFVDVDLETANINTALIEKAITSKTKAILPVDIAGRPCDYSRILEIAKKYNLVVIKDAAHSLGAVYKNKKIGSIADFTIFSFYPTKNITSIEGGMILTHNEKWARDLKILSLHGMNQDAWKRYSSSGWKHYFTIASGWKYNMPDISAALGISQFSRFEESQAKREAIWQKYQKAFKNLAEITIPPEIIEGCKHAYHLYQIRIKPEKLKINRDQFLLALKEEGIGCGVHFTALHLHPFYKRRYGYRQGDFPNAERIGETTISLPFSQKILEGDANDVIKAVKKIVNYYRV